MTNPPPIPPRHVPSTSSGRSPLKTIGAVIFMLVIIGGGLLRAHLRERDRRSRETMDRAMDQGIRDFAADYVKQEQKKNQAAFDKWYAEYEKNLRAGATRPTTSPTRPATEPATSESQQGRDGNRITGS